MRCFALIVVGCVVAGVGWATASAGQVLVGCLGVSFGIADHLDPEGDG